MVPVESQTENEEEEKRKEERKKERRKKKERKKERRKEREKTGQEGNKLKLIKTKIGKGLFVVLLSVQVLDVWQPVVVMVAVQLQIAIGMRGARAAGN